jgi:hypothetical protein
MAHFAKIDLEGNVLEVLVVDNKDITSPEGEEAEVLGQTLLFNLTGHRLWRQTSYTGSMRKNYAGIGHKYDKDRDAFIEKKPHESWILDEETARWKSPKPYPNDNHVYDWDEATQDWVRVKRNAN